jgi:hypothetical protein
VRDSKFYLGKNAIAGVVVHSPSPGNEKHPAALEASIAGATDERVRWMNTTYIELVVDGDIVDLNRVQLPPDTLIIDERFKERKDQSLKQRSGWRNGRDFAPNAWLTQEQGVLIP